MTQSHLALAVLWDLDGTLLDSRELHWLAWRESLAGEGLSLSREKFDASFGQRNDASLAAWFGLTAAGVDFARIAGEKEERYRRLVRKRGVELLPGVEMWLARLSAAGWRQALATSAPRPNVDAILEVLGIGSIFATIVTAEDVMRGKPDPEVFLAAARRLGAPVYRCVVVEDAPVGIEAARLAGMRCIGVGPRYASLRADLTAPSLAALDEDAFDRMLEDPDR
ncbi:MAG: HAD-IA family hydrolase [Dehalococcoidia bacterium]|nr:HAD-IA family hydrolase [Dehalococcoidia bacterium]